MLACIAMQTGTAYAQEVDYVQVSLSDYTTELPILSLDVTLAEGDFSISHTLTPSGELDVYRTGDQTCARFRADAQSAWNEVCGGGAAGESVRWQDGYYLGLKFGSSDQIPTPGSSESVTTASKEACPDNTEEVCYTVEQTRRERVCFFASVGAFENPWICHWEEKVVEVEICACVELDDEKVHPTSPSEDRVLFQKLYYY